MRYNPAALRGNSRGLAVQLEDQLSREPNRTSTVGAGTAAARAVGSRDSAEVAVRWSARSRADSARRSGSTTSVRVVKPRSIRQAEQVRTELEVKALGQLEVLGDADVGVEDSRAAELVTARVAKHCDGRLRERRRIEVVAG